MPSSFIDDTAVRELLEEKKPNISVRSLNSYLTIYRAFCRMFKLKVKDYEQWLTEIKKIMEYVNTSESISTQKTRLAAFVVLARACEASQETINNLFNKMKNLISEYNEQLEQQKFTIKELKNWVTADDLRSMVEDVMVKLKKMGFYAFVSNVNLEKEFQRMVLFILAVTYPVRNEYGNMKVSTDYDGTDDGQNYLLIKNEKRHRYFIYLNSYKTKRKYGQLIIQIKNKEVIKVLKTYLKYYQRGDYLFNSYRKQYNKPMGSNGVTQQLNKLSMDLVGKKFSTGMIRKSLITEELEGTATIQEKKEQTKQMINKYQHSGIIHDTYRRL